MTIDMRLSWLGSVILGALAADPVSGEGILPYLQWLLPWAAFCVTLTTLRIVWQIPEPKPVNRYWKLSMLATGLGLGFVASALAVEIVPGRPGFQVFAVGCVALFPDRVLAIMMKVFDQLEIDPFGLIRKIRGGGAPTND